jgi:LuxR family transcriptional regulator, maltose regulon positive regulatory protein
MAAITEAGQVAPESAGLLNPVPAQRARLLLAQGEIAAELVVTLDTVKKHVSHVLDKLGAANRTQAVARARELGLIT